MSDIFAKSFSRLHISYFVTSWVVFCLIVRVLKRQVSAFQVFLLVPMPVVNHLIKALDFNSPIFREGNGTPLQYSCLENPMDGGAWWAAVHGVAKSQTRLSDFTFTFHFPALEKERATHSSVLAWRIPGMGEPGRLPSMGLHRVGHD